MPCKCDSSSSAVLKSGDVSFVCDEDDLSAERGSRFNATLYRRDGTSAETAVRETDSASGDDTMLFLLDGYGSGGDEEERGEEKRLSIL